MLAPALTAFPAIGSLPGLPLNSVERRAKGGGPAWHRGPGRARPRGGREGRGPAACRQGERRPRPCPRRPLVLRAVTRGLSRKETAPERGGVVSRPCCYLYCRLSARSPVSPSTRSMSGLRVYSTSVTGSREVSACRGPSLGESSGRLDPHRGRGGAGWGGARRGIRPPCSGPRVGPAAPS